MTSSERTHNCWFIARDEANAMGQELISINMRTYRRLVSREIERHECYDEIIDRLLDMTE